MVDVYQARVAIEMGHTPLIEPDMTELYDSIGKTYTATRAADPRITQRLVDLLNLADGSKVLDVGAGTGNYSCAIADAGYSVTALEPSEVMRMQGMRHPELDWRAGSAELLPFENGSFDGVMMTLCIHHFTDWRQAIAEAKRVVGTGPIVILTFDVERDVDFWLFDYFPDFQTKDAQWFPTMDEMKACSGTLNSTCEVSSFPLPPDLKDHFAAAGWARPEIYLQEDYRAGISSFAKADPDSVARGLAQLSSDLSSGQWDKKYGASRTAGSLDVGYVFVKISEGSNSE